MRRPRSGPDERLGTEREQYDDPAPAPGSSRAVRAGRAARATARGTGRAAVVTGRGLLRAGAATWRGSRRAGVATGHGASYTLRQARRATHAEGAGASGLSRVIELHAFNAAGDAAVAISLAGTLFFQVPTDQARTQVLQFLGLTLLPFAVVAPLIGPLLDRVPHGRRWAIGATMALRAFLCWVLSGAVSSGSWALFPAALGVLIASKAYGVTRAAAVPRLLPSGLGLVKANSKVSLAGVAGAAISAPLAIGASRIGPAWSLRYAFLVFVGATILAILLPAKVDHVAAEVPGRDERRRTPVPHAVVIGLRSNAGLRMMSGFLTMFMAFLLRDAPFPGWEHKVALLLGLVIGSAGLGSTLGVALGNVLRSVRPEVLVVVTVLVDTAVAVLVALVWALPTAVLLGLTAGLTQSLGKLSLDALLQREVPEHSRASAFARSETLLQLSWVVGGFVGIVLPLVPQVGLGVAAALLAGWSAWTLAAVRHPR